MSKTSKSNEQGDEPGGRRGPTPTGVWGRAGLRLAPR
jgi:hypothetical protein